MNTNLSRSNHDASNSQYRGVPLAQALALDRRHALDAQQRSFQASNSANRPNRPRPPG